MKCFC